MKKVVICFSALFWAVIVFFTAFGKSLYLWTKPEVGIDWAVDINGEKYLPKDAVFEEPDGAYIYTLNSEAGFSQEILTVTRHKLKEYYSDDSEYFDGYVRIVSEESVGGLFIVSSSKPLYDGERVVTAE